jgi:hypothetical protein
MVDIPIPVSLAQFQNSTGVVTTGRWPRGKEQTGQGKNLSNRIGRELNSGLDLETKILSPPVEAELFS